MRFVCEGKEFLVASAVAIGCEMIGAAVWIEVENAVYFLWTIAILGEETARQLSVCNLYLRAENSDLGQIIGKTVRTGEERLHPIVDAGADNDDIGSLFPRLLQRTNTFWPQ